MSDVLRVDNEDNGDFGSSQFVETRIILPSSQNNSQIRWLLPEAGILAADAFIQFTVTGSDANQRLPLWSGCMSFISSATLQYQGQVIATSRGINHLSTLKNFYRLPHNRAEKQSIRIGSFTDLMVDKCTAAAAPLVEAPGHWGIDIAQDYCDSQGATAADPSGQTRSIATGYRLTNNAATSPEWRVYLADLFPIIYHNGLPLGLLDGRFSVVIDLEQDIVRGQRTVGSAAGGWVAGNLVVNQPRLCVDLTFYDDPPGVSTMEELRENLDKGQLIPYSDYHYVLHKQTAGAINTIATNNVLLGLDHQVVRSIYVSTPEEETYGAPTTSGDALLGNYYSYGSNGQASATGTNGGNRFNLTVNSVPVYPQDLDSDNKILNQLSQCMPTPFKQNSCIVSSVGQVGLTGIPGTAGGGAGQIRLTQKTLNGSDQQDIRGKAHYYGCNLSKSYINRLGEGTPIGRQSVILKLTDMLRDVNLGPKTLHIFAECERALAIKNGDVAVTGS